MQHALAALGPLLSAAVLAWMIVSAPWLLVVNAAASAVAWGVARAIGRLSGAPVRAHAIGTPLVFALGWVASTCGLPAGTVWAVLGGVGVLGAVALATRPPLAARWRAVMEAALAPLARLALLTFLGALYLFVLVPTAIVLRVARPERMHLAPDAAVPSYWHDVADEGAGTAYLRQY